MSYGELQGFKQLKGYMTSKLHITTTNSNLYGQTVTVKDSTGTTILTGSFNNSGVCDFLTDVCGELTITCNSVVKRIKVTSYATYNVEFSSVYGFKIEKANSNPSSRVTPIAGCRNEDFLSAYMDYSTNTFNYGSWEDAFFMPKPCMLKSDGTVDYYLDVNDYTKKEDGVTASEVANTSYDGNAMMEFPKVYVHAYEDTNYEYYEISDTKISNDFKCYAHLDQNGNEIPYCYMPIYNGSLISNKIRSLSGQAIMKTQTGSNEITYATANGNLWYTELLVDRLLINNLLVLMGMSTDTQAVFGQGLTTSGTETTNNSFRTGVHNDKGLFYGTNSGAASTYTNAVKVFGMENWWGLQWRRIGGYINASGTQKIKLTYGTADGSTVTGYNQNGNGYITVSNATPSGTSGGYINVCKLIEGFGRIPVTASGSETTFEKDGLWFNNSQTDYAIVGGSSVVAGFCGAFAVYLYVAVSFSLWSIGASLSCKPNAVT